MVQDITIRDTGMKRTAQIANEWEKVITALGPEGKVPTIEQLRTRFKKGTATVRDGIIARLYREGVLFKMDSKVIEEDFPRMAKKINAFQNNFQSQVYDESTKSLKTTNTLSGLISDINKLTSGIAKDKPGINDPLNLKITELEDLFDRGISNTKAATWTPTQKQITKFKQGEVYQEPKGKNIRKGTRVLKEIDSKKVLNRMLNNIAQIKDVNMKAAILIAMFGQRGEALVNMSNSEVNATRYGPTEYVPFYDPETKEIVNPSDRTGFTKKGGRKLLPPTTKVGPLSEAILNYMHGNTKGDLFKIDKKKLVDTLNKIVYKNIEPETKAMMGRDLKGYTDLRRIFASTVINEMADKVDDIEMKTLYYKYADQLLGHNNTKAGMDASNDLIAKIMRDHYAVIKQGTSILQTGDIMSEFEKFFAEAMGATDSEGKLSVKVLAASLGIDDTQIKGLDKVYTEINSNENPNKKTSEQTKKKIKTISTNVLSNAETQSKINVITGEKELNDALRASYMGKLADGKKMDLQGTNDEIVKQVEAIQQREFFYKSTAKNKKPIVVDENLVNDKLVEKMKKAKELGMTLREYTKSLKGKGVLGSAFAGIVLGTAGGMFSNESRAGDLLSAVVPMGMEPGYIGGRGRGLKYPGTDNILTGEDENFERLKDPEMYEQMEATFKRDQAYEQEQDKIKKEFKKDEQEEQMQGVFPEGFGS